MRLLLVEDDAMIGGAIEQGLRGANMAVDWVHDGHSAELALSNGVYQLLVLDLGLPRKDGLELLRGIRTHGNAMPVLVVTARDAVADRIAGLNAGADDYLIKPFDLDELIARVHALMRRHSGRGSPVIQYGALRVNPLTREVSLHDKSIELSAREFSVLEALLHPPGAVVSRANLEEAVYGWNEEVGSNAVEVYLHHLRRKLGQEVIRNVRGVGYRVAEVS
jgi:two-component system response regulator QseB